MGFHLVMLHLTLDERSRSKQRSQIYSAVLFSTQSVYRWLFKQLTCRDGSHWFCLEKHRSDLQIVQKVETAMYMHNPWHYMYTGEH